MPLAIQVREPLISAPASLKPKYCDTNCLSLS